MKIKIVEEIKNKYVYIITSDMTMDSLYFISDNKKSLINEINNIKSFLYDVYYSGKWTDEEKEKHFKSFINYLRNRGIYFDDDYTHEVNIDDMEVIGRNHWRF